MTDQTETERYTYSVEDVAKQVLGDCTDLGNESEIDRYFSSLIKNRGYVFWGKRPHGDNILFKLTGRDAREQLDIDLDHDPEIIIAGLIHRGVFKQMGEEMHPNLPRYILDRAINMSIRGLRASADHKGAHMEYFPEWMGPIIPVHEARLNKLQNFQMMLRAKNGTHGNPERR